MKQVLILKKRIFSSKSFSLLELLVTLGIMVILLTMISNVFVEVMRINIVNKERAFVREESSILLAQIRRDIRNADKLSGCDFNPITDKSSNSCSFVLTNQTFKWNFEPILGDFAGDGYVAKKYLVDSAGGPDKLIYTSTDGILFDVNDTDKRVFTILTDPNDTNGQLTVVIKFIAKSLPGEPHGTPAVNNVIKQTIVSARNFSSN